MNKEQRKIFKEREISEFIDAANEHGFNVTQTLFNHETCSITLRDKKEQVPILSIGFVGFMDKELPDDPFSLTNSNFFDDESGFDRLAWLLKRSNQLMDRLRYNTKDVKPEVEDIHDENQFSRFNDANGRLI